MYMSTKQPRRFLKEILKNFSDVSSDGSNKKEAKQKNVNEFDEEWFVQHCRQVCVNICIKINKNKIV